MGRNSTGFTSLTGRVRKAWLNVKNSPMGLFLCLLVPVVYGQLMGPPTLIGNIENLAFPPERSIGLLHLPLAPTGPQQITGLGPVAPWSDLLLFQHNSRSASELILFSSTAENADSLATGWARPTPPLISHLDSVDPRAFPLLQINLPPKVIAAAAVHHDGGSNEQRRFWISDPKSAASSMFNREKPTIITLTKSELISLNTLWFAVTCVAVMGALQFSKAKPLIYGDDGDQDDEHPSDGSENMTMKVEP